MRRWKGGRRLGRALVRTRGRWNWLVDRFDRLGLGEDAILLGFGVAVGIAGALGVIVFFSLIDFAFGLLFGVLAAGLPRPDMPFYRPLLTAAGFAAAFALVRRFAPTADSRPKSVQLIPLIQVAVARSGGALPFRPTLARIGASIITLGSGGAAGSEGPIAVVGATAGSFLGRAFRFDASRVKVLVAAGAAAGISAAFNAPLAGAFFALGEILGGFAVGAFAPVVIASVVAAVISRSVFGDHPALVIPMEYGYHAIEEVLFFYPLLGVVAGLVTVLFVRTFFGAERIRDRIRIPASVVPWIGGAMVGILVLLSRGHLVGYGHLAIRLDVFAQLSWYALLLLALGEILATSITLNSGGSGGVFAPSLYVGAATGASFGVALQALFPGMGLQPEAYALVGMGAVFAAATDAPLAAVLMVFEMTNDYAIVLPLMLAVVISYGVAKRIEGDSLYSGWLRRRGESIERGVVRDVLATLRVADAMEENPQVIGETASVTQLLEHLWRGEQTDYPVVDDRLRVTGVIRIGEIGRIARDHADLGPLILASDIAIPVETIGPGDSLLTAIRRMGTRGAGMLPVVDGPDGRLVGVVTRAAILALYEKEVAGQAAEGLRPADPLA